MNDKSQHGDLLDAFLDFVGKVSNVTTISLEGVEDALDKGDKHADKIDKLISQVGEQPDQQVLFEVLKEANAFMKEVNSSARTWKVVNEALVAELAKVNEVLQEEIKKNKEQG